MAKILLADDEEALRLLLGRQLRRAGHEVTLAEDGLVAAERLAVETFDLVVSDMKMPRLDGMGLLARAKELAPATEFVILTGHGNMENAVLAFKSGNVFDYLLKPLDDIHELDAVVERAVERRFLRSENGRLVGELQARIVELEAARQELSFLAERDGLTGLLNHRAMHARLNAALEMTTPLQTESEPETETGAGVETGSEKESAEAGKAADATNDVSPVVSVMLLDMDRFKQLNDTYGHPVGDQILRHVGQALEAVYPDSALIGRCGGDEFMVVMTDSDAQAARTLALDVQRWLHDTPFVNPEGTPLPLRLCFGIADTVGTGRSPLNLVASADAALYESKRQGGDTITLHSIASADGNPLGRSAFTVLEGLVTAIDHKDQYTKAHSEDMTGYALQLTQALGCSESVYDVVRVAGLLHDVGKIGVPDSILRKPGRLTPEEYEVMKNHVTLSAAIIHGLPNLADILDAVAHHHERWDGNGYPGGLAGEKIPLLGRIMAIADAFSAMTLDRPYRVGISLDAALAEIERGAGTQFDPNLTPLFIKTIRARQQEMQFPERRAA